MTALPPVGEATPTQPHLPEYQYGRAPLAESA
jgi:hypothetical protein